MDAPETLLNAATDGVDELSSSRARLLLEIPLRLPMLAGLSAALNR